MRPGPESGSLCLPRPGGSGGLGKVRNPPPSPLVPESLEPPSGRPIDRLGQQHPVSSPAEVQQGPSGGWSALCRPAEEVELSEGARLLGLHVLQVEAPHQEVLAPDVLRHQVHLPRNGVRV